MAFTPRNFETILIDMVNHVRANTSLTDFNIGSVVRTILEAAALEDDEQYFQMVQLLDSTRITTATGADLSERAADMNTQRLEAAPAYGQIYIQNGNLTTNTLTYNIDSGVSSFALASTADFPTAPPNYVVRLGEGTPQVEDVTVSNNSTGSNILTITGVTLNDHTAGERVSVVAGSSITISKGVMVQVPATSASTPIKYSTSESGAIVAGNYQSGLIDVQASEPGTKGNVSSGQISQFTSTSPFAGATVTNAVSTSGGRDDETDPELRDRLLRKYDELSRGTPYAIESAVIGIEDVTTGKRIVTAKLREDYVNHHHTLYVDDGTGLVPDAVQMARTTFSAVATAGATVNIQITNATEFPSSGNVILSPGVTGFVEHSAYSAKGPGNVLTLDSPVTKNHAIGEEVVFVDLIEEASEDGQNYFKLDQWPIKSNSYEIYDDRTGELELRTDVTDYFLNITNADLQFPGAGLAEGTKLLGHYTYYTGLLQLAQRVINGDPDNRVTYPGVAAGGVVIRLDTPIVRSITITLAIQVEAGFDNTEVSNEARRIVENYVDGQGIGGNIILARVVEKVMSVDGVRNVSIRYPTNDISVLEDELPVSYDNNGTSLVTVL